MPMLKEKPKEQTRTLLLDRVKPLADDNLNKAIEKEIERFKDWQKNNV